MGTECVNRLACMEKVVQLAHCIEGGYVFGGYVRDYVINQQMPKDVDISVPSLPDAESFIRTVACTFDVAGHEDKNHYIWQCGQKMKRITVTVGPRIDSCKFQPFVLDVTVRATSVDPWFTDFTCNILAFSRTGSASGACATSSVTKLPVRSRETYSETSGATAPPESSNVNERYSSSIARRDAA
jgi:hypothetical protein